MSGFWPSFLTILIILVVLYVVITLFFYLIQEKIIFQSWTVEEDYKYDFDFDFEEVTITPDINTRLHGLIIKSKPSKGVVLYLHGNKGDLRRWAPIAHGLTKYNYDVLVVDYRGYGKSKGVRSELNLHADAILWYDFLEQNYSEDIVVYGRSLGSGMAVKLAATKSPKLLILETPYHSLIDLVRRYFIFIPMKWMVRYEFRSNLFIDKVVCSTVIFHGTDDQIVPITSALKLTDESNKSRVNFIKIDGGKHNNLNTFEVYQAELERTLLEIN